jgi:hypothetical protein
LGLYIQLNLQDKTASKYDHYGWLWIVLLATTGMFQMSANPNYDGLLQINSIWATALLAKHILIILLIFLMGIQTFYFLPTITRYEWMKLQSTKEPSVSFRIDSYRKLILKIEGVIFVLVLIATGITRAS